MLLVYIPIIVLAYALIVLFCMALILGTGIGLAEATIWVAGTLDYQLPIDKPLLWLSCIVFAWMTLVLLACAWKPSFPANMATEIGARNRNEVLIGELRSLTAAVRDVKTAVESVKNKLP